MRSMFLSLVLATVFHAADKPLPYVDGCAQSLETGKPLVVFVGSAKPIELADAIHCRVDSLEGYRDGDIVLAEPSSGKLYFSRKLNAVSALDEVNAQRAARGLRPYLFDAGLTAAAEGAAAYRAANLIEGHVNDFSFLPQGVTAACAGCAAWEPGWGFGACDLYADWTYCGAAAVMGRDGKRYCHCFYR